MAESTTAAQLLLQCYNKGCGLQYEADKNHPEACWHHPGEPFFHDAYKGWTCCNKKSTDFTEFLNTKGCTRSSHSNVKPANPERPAVDKSAKEEVIVVTVPKLKTFQNLARPRHDAPMVRLPVTILPSLKHQLETQREQVPPTQAVDDNSSGAVAVGTSCKNAGCKRAFANDSSNSEACLYHTGYPVFHEGLKFWTCCQRKTTDFDNFLNQEGCSVGMHCWVKSEEDQDRKVACRDDWHQTGNFVFLSIYAKSADPTTSYVEANSVKLHVHITSSSNVVFDKELILRGVVDIQKSSVTFGAAKVEVKLKKADIMSWDVLSISEDKHITTITDDISLDNINLT